MTKSSTIIKGPNSNIKLNERQSLLFLTLAVSLTKACYNDPVKEVLMHCGSVEKMKMLVMKPIEVFLTHSLTRNFRLFQTETLCRRQF